MDATFVADEKLRGRIERTLADIDNEDSRQAVFDHLEERAANGDKDETLRNTTNSLRNVANFLAEEYGLSFQKVRPQTHKVPDINPETGEEIERIRLGAAKELIAWQSTADLAKSTLSSRRDILRSFYAWLRKSPKNEYPPEVATLPTVSQSQDSTPTDRIISPAELKQMLDAHDHPRDRAILAVLYEAGLRRGEMVSLALENVEFDQYGAVVVLPKHATDLKTGSRRVRILDAEPYLRQWIESHPAKDDPSAPCSSPDARTRTGSR